MATILNPNLFKGEDGGPVAFHRIEQMLDAHLIKVKISNERWWTIRRNGQTQRWKRDANRFRIPIKAGLKVCGAITEKDLVEL